MSRKKQHGFTIIELLFSTVIFSIILLLALASLVQIGKLYYKGVTTAQTQEVARNVVDEISQAIQLSSGAVSSPSYTGGPDIAAATSSTGYFCIGDTRYSYAIDKKLTEGSVVPADKEISHVLWADRLVDCANVASVTPLSLTSANPGGTNGRELLGANMRILKLNISKPVSTVGNVWQIDLIIAYGDEDLFTVNSGRKYCKTAQAGTQFCATSEISTVVNRRIAS